MRQRIRTSFLAGCALVSHVQAQAPARPDAHLGHALAADNVLPDWNEVRGYFEKLDRESPRVLVQKVGTTTEGRDFVLAVISSEANLARLDEIKHTAALLHDPRLADAAAREAALAQGRVLVFISCAMHATECAAPQFAMQFAWELATSDEEPWRSARENCVVLLAPSLNPDGLDHVVEWYRKTVGTPYESAELPELYQHYAGHDNNRDWFALALRETRIVTELLYSTWHPQVYWDVHQQGSKAERLFVPPFRDPLDPNIDPAIVCGMNLLGTRAQADLTREGRKGVASGGTFDMWWNGGNRNVPVRHNMVGLLTEAASCRLASPIYLQPSDLRGPGGAKSYAPSNSFPAPWPGGWWRIADIVDYELAFARSLLGSLSRERRYWLETQLAATQRTLDGDVPGMPLAWVVPSWNADRGAAARLADVLLASGIEIGACVEPFAAGGRKFPSGSLVISAHQPYARHVKDLFETQDYPPGDPPYDVAGWTLPTLFGLETAELREEFDARIEPVRSAANARDAFARGPRPKLEDGELCMCDSDAWKDAFARLERGETLTVSPAGAGTFSTKGRASSGSSFDSSSASEWRFTGQPRIGLYAPWSGSVDEGWTRWVFDEFGVRYTRVRNEALRAGNLRQAFDVLVLPGIGQDELEHGREEGSVFDELAGGLAPEGTAAIDAFVNEGGTLIAIGSSCAWATSALSLPVVDVTAGPEAKELSCPGSVLRAVPEVHAFTQGLSESVAVFGSAPKALRAMNEKEREAAHVTASTAEVLLRYAPARTLISGYLAHGETLAGQAAWMRVAHGDGHVHLFGFRPHYRSWSQAAFQLLFRALLFEGTKR